MDFNEWRRGIAPSSPGESDVSQSYEASNGSQNTASRSNGADAVMAARAGKWRAPARKQVIPDSDSESGDSPQKADTTGGSSIVILSKQPMPRVKQTSRMEDQRLYPNQPPRPSDPQAGKATATEPSQAPRPAASRIIEIPDTPPEAPRTSSSRGQSSFQSGSSFGSNVNKAQANKLPDFRRIAQQPAGPSVAFRGDNIKLDSPLRASAPSFKPRPDRPQTPIYDISSASAASSDLPDPWKAGPSVPSPRQQRYKYGQVKQEPRPMTAKDRITAEFNAENKRAGIPIGKPLDPTRNMPGWAQPLADKTNGSISDDVAHLPNSMNQVSAEKAVKELVQGMYADMNNVDTKAPAPRGLECTLLAHQLQGVNWMLNKERGREKGGLLADDMGLGKTVQSIGLILGNRPDKYASERKTTLIVGPLALMRQWLSEIELHVSKKARLKCALYHGSDRKKIAANFGAYDVVMTTYQTLANERASEKKEQAKADRAAQKKYKQNGKGEKKKRSNDRDSSGNSTDSNDSSESDTSSVLEPIVLKHGPLIKNKWWRVILDEAHTIKNQATNGARACFLLDSKYRWCLTGTPIQNGLHDLQSLFHFLKAPKPVDEFSEFKTRILEPMKRSNGGVSIKRLQVYLKAVMLRRTKDTMIDGKPIFVLPPREVHVIKTDFDDQHERDFYMGIKEKSNVTMNKYVKAGTVMQNITNILTAILRMRQACDHPHIIRDSTAKSDKEGIFAKQPKSLESEDNDDDVDGLAGLLGGLGIGSGKCATCQISFKVKRPSKNHPRFCIDCDEEMDSDKFAYSTKIRQLMDKLEEIREEDSTRRVIVFSQFTSMLALIKPFLERAGFRYVEYNGSMRIDQREDSLAKIRGNNKYTIILVSFKCGSVGLNLTCCSVVCLLDLWWNPALENQAIDRAHRFGQKRQVDVYKFTIIDTIEQRILELQEKKAAVSAAAIDGGDIQAMSKLTEKELLHLMTG